MQKCHFEGVPASNREARRETTEKSYQSKDFSHDKSGSK